MNDDMITSLAHWKLNSADWVRDVLRVEPVPDQIKLLTAYDKPGAHVTARSGHGCGKTSGLAWIIMHYLAFYDKCRVPCTAPAAPQLTEQLWPEVRIWHNRMSPWWKKQYRIISNKIMWQDPKDPGAITDRFALARTSRKEKPEALAGQHAPNMLFTVDEASGVPSEIFTTVEGALSTPGAKVILTSNPTRRTGYFYETHKDPLESPNWEKLHFNSENSPLVEKNWIEKFRRRYDRNDTIYRVRVRGEFPEEDANTVVSMGDVEDALRRDQTHPNSPTVAGLDVARFGDDSCARVIRRGFEIIGLKQWRGKDLVWTAREGADGLRSGAYQKLFIDIIGNGSGVYDTINNMGLAAAPVNVSNSAVDGQRFSRLRDELWFHVADYFRSDLASINLNIPRDEQMDFIDEICSVTYDYLPESGKIKVESKDKLKDRGLDSPNMADALCLTFAGDVAGCRVRDKHMKSRAKPVVPTKNGAFLG